MGKPKPAFCMTIDGKPRTKENKGQYGSSFYYKKHRDIYDWEVDINHGAIEAMKDLGFPGPYRGRCEIAVAMTYESWKKCDITNYWKSLNDAFNGAVWVDDSQVDAAHIVRLIDRDEPKTFVMIWFYDFSFEEEYNTKCSRNGKAIMKYPDKYERFEFKDYELVTDFNYVSDIASIPSKRWGTFRRKETFDEMQIRKKGKRSKPRQRKPNRKRIVANEKAKSEKRNS